MDIKSISLMQKLINFTTSNNIDCASGVLANYFLLHYDELERIPLSQVVSDCFLSISSVRRFCQKIGYDNYSDLIRSKLCNPENQKEIAASNIRFGRYHPATLRNEINENLYMCYRALSPSQIQALTQRILEADAVILICTRPYSLWIQEFSNQLIAWGKPTYVIEEPTICKTICGKFGSNILTIIISPLGILPEAYAPQIQLMAGKKVLIASKFLTDTPVYSTLSDQYDDVVLLPFKQKEYEYMEVLGKYTIGFLFDVLLGEIVNQLL